MVEYKVEDKVEHILSGNWLTVLSVMESEVVCRTKDCRTVTLFKWEIKPVHRGLG